MHSKIKLTKVYYLVIVGLGPVPQPTKEHKVKKKDKPRNSFKFKKARQLHCQLSETRPAQLKPKKKPQIHWW